MKNSRGFWQVAIAAALPLVAGGEEPPESAEMLKIPAAETRPSDAPPVETDVTASPESAESPSPAEPAPTVEESGGEQPAGAHGVVLPAFPLSRYQSLWERSPFQLESVAPPVESAGLAQRFALTGIAEINREPIAFVMERATQKRMMVKKDVGEGGVSLVQIDIQKNYNDSTVTLRQGAEVGVVRFDAAAAGAVAVAPPTMLQVPQPSGVPSPARIQPGQPGQSVPTPGIVPAVPGPGVPQDGQMQSDPGQMPSPRVIRRRALIPAAP